MDRRSVGNSLIAMGVTALVGSVISSVVLGALLLDFGMAVIVWFGFQVRRGWRPAAVWGIVLLAFYFLASGGLAAGLLLSPNSMFAGSLRPGAAAVTGVASLGYALWSAVNIWLLVGFLRSIKGPDPRCGACGHVLHPSTLRCPECGELVT